MQIFNGLDFIFIDIDNILVAGRSHKEHIIHLREFLNRLRTASLVLNLPKCTFGRSSVDFLGHLVSSQGIRPLAAKVEALRSHPRPNTIKEIQQFLGLLNFYRRFLPGAAKGLAPLTKALKGSPSGPTRIQWSAAMLIAFNEAKNSLSTTAELSHPSPQAKLALLADTSTTHVGAALHQQRHPGSPWEQLGFFSKKLDSSQVSYSAFACELLAAFCTVQHFRFQVEGRPFLLRTDHRALTYALGCVSDAWTPHQQRQLSYIAEYTNDIQAPSRCGLAATGGLPVCPATCGHHHSSSSRCSPAATGG